MSKREETPLDANLDHRLLRVFREGMHARDTGAEDPYHAGTLEHCLHASGWVSRDLSLALQRESGGRYTAPELLGVGTVEEAAKPIGPAKSEAAHDPEMDGALELTTDTRYVTREGDVVGPLWPCGDGVWWTDAPLVNGRVQGLTWQKNGRFWEEGDDRNLDIVRVYVEREKYTPEVTAQAKATSEIQIVTASADGRRLNVNMVIDGKMQVFVVEPHVAASAIGRISEAMALMALDSAN